MSSTEGGGVLISVDEFPVPRVKYAEVIADELRMHIIRAKAGDYLPPERELIERYGVSRPTFREALRILEVEGLIEIRRGAQGGALIKEPSIDTMTRTFGVYVQRHGVTLRDVFDARLELEPIIARLAASNADGDLSELTDVVAREQASVARATGDIGELEVDFHVALMDVAGNFTLRSLGRLLTSIVGRHASDTVRQLGPRSASGRILAEKGHRAHALILDAIRKGDPTKAEQRMVTHLRSVCNELAIDASAPAIAIGPSGQP